MPILIQSIGKKLEREYIFFFSKWICMDKQVPQWQPYQLVVRQPGSKRSIRNFSTSKIKYKIWNRKTTTTSIQQILQIICQMYMTNRWPWWQHPNSKHTLASIIINSPTFIRCISIAMLIICHKRIRNHRNNHTTVMAMRWFHMHLVRDRDHGILHNVMVFMVNQLVHFSILLIWKILCEFFFSKCIRKTLKMPLKLSVATAQRLSACTNKINILEVRTCTLVIVLVLFWFDSIWLRLVWSEDSNIRVKPTH